MQQHIGVAMTDETLMMRNANPTQKKRTAGGQSVGVVSDADACVKRGWSSLSLRFYLGWERPCAAASARLALKQPTKVKPVARRNAPALGWQYIETIPG
jgi:hypothetical protein